MASGTTLLIFTAYSMIPTPSNFAEFTTRNGHPLYAFDKDSKEYLYTEAVMPQYYSGNGINVYITYCCTATSGGVAWKLSFDRIDCVQSIDSDSWATVKTFSSQVSEISGIMTITNQTFTTDTYTDGITAGDCFRLRVQRAVSDVGDTAEGDAQIYMIELREI